MHNKKMATNNVTCSACLNIIKHKQYLVCSTCSQKYDIGCLNITEKRFLSLDIEQKNNWLCVKCKNKQPKKDNSNTPIRGTLQDNQSSSTENSDCQNITKRKKASKMDVSPSTSRSVNELITGDCYSSLLSSLRLEIHVAVNEAVNKTVESYFAKQFESLKDELSTLKDLKSAIEFLSADYDRVKTDLQICNEKLACLTIENTKLSESVKDLNSRLSMLEQYSRERNIEINGIPESKAENLFTVVKQLCTTVSVPINDNDIVTCVRVRKMNPESKLPRSVVVKLQSTKLRDEIIAAIGRTLIPRYFRSIYEGGVSELYYTMRQPKESFHNTSITLDCDHCTMVTHHGKPMFTKVCTEGRLILEFTFDDLMRIKSWHMAVRAHRELIPRQAVHPPDHAALDQLAKNITRQGITNSTLNYLRLCVILEPMQELMSRHKAYALSPRDCLKTTLFQKWQRMVAPPESQRPASKRRKRKGSAGANAAPPAPTKKRSPGPNFSLASQDVMVVGEPSLMGGEFGDEDERLITRLENTQYEGDVEWSAPPASPAKTPPAPH